MNKIAVALAADSAATVPGSSGQKIYNSVNKLFRLSRAHPVGIMINESSELMGVPWELLVKGYRAELGSRSFDFIDDYSSDFFRWISFRHDLFPREVQVSSYRQQTTDFLREYVVTWVNDQVRRELDSTGESSISSVSQLIKNRLEVVRDWLAQRSEAVLFGKDVRRQRMPDDLWNSLSQSVGDAFAQLPLDEASAEIIGVIGWHLVQRQGVGSQTGVVIAGFGEKEAFPALRAYDVEFVWDNVVKAVPSNEAKVNLANRSIIVPFAQREMVDTFMRGVAPRHRTFITGFMDRFFSELPESLLALLPGLEAQQRSQLVAQLQRVGVEAREGFERDFEARLQAESVAPVVDAVEILPKDELAAMAEALVNLTSFKRRVSVGEVESVGGPIDVAVISKGDGFVWIRRKHYFDAYLNPRFVANYLQGELTDE